MFAWILTFCYCSLAQPLIMLSNMLFHLEIFEASVRLIKTNKITCPTYGWMISEEMMADLSVIPEDMHVFYWFYSKMEHNCCLRIPWKILFDICEKEKQTVQAVSGKWRMFTQILKRLDLLTSLDWISQLRQTLLCVKIMYVKCSLFCVFML